MGEWQQDSIVSWRVVRYGWEVWNDFEQVVTITKVEARTGTGVRQDVFVHGKPVQLLLPLELRHDERVTILRGPNELLGKSEDMPPSQVRSPSALRVQVDLFDSTEILASLR